MERGWQRRHSFVELPDRELGRLVVRALPGARVVGARPLTAGLRNTNYRVDLASGAAVVLRLYVADPEACGREAAVLSAVAGRVPAPRLLYSDPTATPPFSLLEWLDGMPLHEVLDGADVPTAGELAGVCGTALARIHEIHFPAPGFLGPELRVIRPMPTWAAALLETLAGPVEASLGPELAAAVREIVESNAGFVHAVWSEAMLVHADYKPWNLLARQGPPASPSAPVSTSAPDAADTPGSGAGAWRLTGILDWEFACAGCKLIDFATFLRDEEGRPAGFGDAFASAYLAAGGTLPNDWRRLTRLVDLLNLMQLLRSGDPRTAGDVRRLVAGTIGGS
jgi:Ser/Thr protein kinase RdoA (MazF antagonist)